MKIKTILDFGVSTVILNIIEISYRSWKLNFVPLRDQVKSRHLTEKIDARRQYFNSLCKSLKIIDRKRHGKPSWIMIWIYYYLLNGIILGLHLDNSCYIRKIPNIVKINIIIWFFTLNTVWHRKIKLAKLDCITNCSTDKLK